MILLEFLGTGGGRFSLASQLRATGGFRIITDQAIHVDPGPGALANYKRFGFALHISLIFVSHLHTDHANDVNALVEAMTEGGTRKKGTVLIEKQAFEEWVTSYHRSLTNFELIEEKPYVFGKTRIEPIPIKHNAPGFGFILEYKGIKLWYSSDTSAYSRLFELRPDFAVLNTILLKKSNAHLSIEHAIELLLEQRPKLAIIQHFGRKLLSFGPEKAAKLIEKETGVETIAARDGLRLELSLQRGLNEWISS